MAGDLCITKTACDRYSDLMDQFSELGTWLGPPDVDAADISSASLRTWWTAHGCVRCFIKACRKYTSGEWSVDCEEVGDHYRISKPKVVPEIDKAITDWKNPGSRLADRFYCADCVVPLPCGAALFQGDKEKVLGGVLPDAGHTAWAYGIPEVWQDETLYNYPEGQDTPGPWRVGEKVFLGGGRDITTEDARLFYKDQGYAAWKGLWSRDGNFEEAFLMALTALETPYALFVYNNCNQATHAVLTAFGADLIPTGDDFWKGTYVPGDYFNFIRVKAEYFYGFDVPQPQPGPAPTTPKRPSRRQSHAFVAKALRRHAASHLRRMETASNAVLSEAQAEPCADRPGRETGSEPAGTDAVYRLEPGSALHLTRTCPALRSAATLPEEFGIAYTDDVRELEATFEAPVCGTCLRLLASGPRVVQTMRAAGTEVVFCRDRLQLHRDGEVHAEEILYERITGVDAAWFSWSYKLTITCRVPLPNGIVASRSVSLAFDTGEARDVCLAEIRFAVSGIELADI